MENGRNIALMILWTALTGAGIKLVWNFFEPSRPVRRLDPAMLDEQIQMSDTIPKNGAKKKKKRVRKKKKVKKASTDAERLSEEKCEPHPAIDEEEFQTVQGRRRKTKAKEQQSSRTATSQKEKGSAPRKMCGTLSPSAAFPSNRVPAPVRAQNHDTQSAEVWEVVSEEPKSSWKGWGVKLIESKNEDVAIEENSGNGKFPPLVSKMNNKKASKKVLVADTPTIGEPETIQGSEQSTYLESSIEVDNEESLAEATRALVEVKIAKSLPEGEGSVLEEREEVDSESTSKMYIETPSKPTVPLPARESSAQVEREKTPTKNVVSEVEEEAVTERTLNLQTEASLDTAILETTQEPSIQGDEFSNFRTVVAKHQAEPKEIVLELSSSNMDTKAVSDAALTGRAPIPENITQLKNSVRSMVESKPNSQSESIAAQNAFTSGIIASPVSVLDGTQNPEAKDVSAATFIAGGETNSGIDVLRPERDDKDAENGKKPDAKEQPEVSKPIALEKETSWKNLDSWADRADDDDEHGDWREDIKNSWSNKASQLM